MAAASVAVASGLSNSMIPPTIPLENEDESALESASSSTSTSNPNPNPTNNKLITSPYTTPEHTLDLSTLNTPNRLLARSLTILSPILPDYATAPYISSFNWPTVISNLQHLSKTEDHTWTKQSFYVVAFRSVLKETANPDRLHLLDERSHAEAVSSGGLLKYWFGVKNGRRENLATCIWRSREDARAGGTGPWHAQARGAARELYEKIEFVTMELVIGDGWEWEFRPYSH